MRDVELAGGEIEDSNIPYEPESGEQQDYPETAFEPMLVIAGISAASYLVKEISKVWKDRKERGGVVVDARKDRIRIRKVPSMQAGTVIVLRNNRTSRFGPEKAEEGMKDLADVLSKLPGSQ